MNIAPLADVKARFSAYIKQLQKAPVIVTKNGRPVAVMIGISDTDDLERIMLAISPRFQALLDKAENRIQETGGISHDEVWAQIDADAKA
jgi:prevent-host-death family protein